MSFGELLRGHRIAVGLTQEELAEQAGVSGQAVGALERGDRRFPHGGTVGRLADALGLGGQARAEFVAAAARPRRPRVSAERSGGRAYRQVLPGDVADFTGRKEEVETCLRWVSAGAGQAPLIVGINGMAGCGKSTLTVHLAHTVADRFPDGQFFVDLHGYTAGHEPMPALTALGDLLRYLGVPGAEVPSGLDARAALWRSELADRRTLIVLDNALDAGQVRPLLPGTPGHLVLITSRTRLVDLDGAVDLPLEPMPAADAAALFVRAAQRPIGDGAGVAALVELCGRLPLAIRLAATQFRHRRLWTVSVLAERLRDQGQRLAELSAGSRSVAGAFELSYRQLTGRQRLMFRLLGLHPGADIDPYAAAALAGLTVADARRCLEHLADAQLLREHATDRYIFHDLLREYARTTAHEHEPDTARRAAMARLVDYYLSAAASANRVADPHRRRDPVDVDNPDGELPSFPGPQEVLAWFETEQANLMSAVHIAALGGRDVQAWQLAQALVSYFSQTGYAQSRYDIQRVALRSARRVGDRLAEANIMVDLGSASHRLGQRDEARELYATAAALGREIGDAHVEGRALRRRAIVYQSDGDYPRAEQLFGAALALFRSIGDRRHEGGALACLAVLYEHAGRFTESMRTFQDALSIMDRLGPLVYPGRVYDGQAWLYWRLGKTAKARTRFDHALRLAREVGDREGEVRALLGLGFVHSQTGQPDEARACYQHILHATDRGMWIGTKEARALAGLGFVHSRLGQHSEAVALYDKALSIATNYGSRVLRVRILNDLADTHAAAGRPADAAGHHRQALELAQEIVGPQPDAARLRAEQTRAQGGLARLDHAG